MGKKKHRSKLISKGERCNISKEAVKAARQEVSPFIKELNKVRAWRAGKNPWITVPGPSAKERYTRVKAVTLWGDPKKIRGIFTREDENV